MTKKFELPDGWTNPKIVIGYDNQIKLMVKLDKVANNAATDEEIDKLTAKLKIRYLEAALGYKIEKFENIVSHKDYEKGIKLKRGRIDYKPSFTQKLKKFTGRDDVFWFTVCFIIGTSVSIAYKSIFNIIEMMSR